VALPRATLVEAMTGELEEVLELADIDPVDQTGDLKEPIDRTFRALGVAEVDLATASAATGSEAKAIAYATYFVLYKATAALVAQMNMSSAGARAELRQQYENVRDRMREALEIAQGFGLSIATGGSAGVAPIPFAGGIESADYEGVADSSSRMPPLFDLRDLEIPGVFAVPSPED